MIARGCLILAIVVSAAVVLSAPFVGLIRAALRTAFPGRFVAIVGGAVITFASRNSTALSAYHR